MMDRSTKKVVKIAVISLVGFFVLINFREWRINLFELEIEPGMTERQIVSRLGRPDRVKTNEFRTLEYRTEKEQRIHEHSSYSSYRSLKVQIDSNGVVIKVESSVTGMHGTLARKLNLFERIWFYIRY